MTSMVQENLTPQSLLADQLVAFCRGAFPCRNKLAISNLAQINGGWECEIYSFVLESGEKEERKQEDLILRLFEGSEAASKAKSEFRVMRQLRQIDYPVPWVLVLADKNSPFGKPFVIMEKIEGQVLSSMVCRPSGEPEPHLLHLFCKLLADLHRLDWRPAVSDISRYQTQGLIGSWIAKFQALVGQFEVTDYNEVLDWLQARTEAVTPTEPTVVHGDFHPGNVLLRIDGAPFVIDWTGADISDARFDLCWTLVLINEFYGLTLRDQILAEYQRITGARVENLEVFEVAAALQRLASLTILLRKGGERFGMRPGVETKIMQHLDHVQLTYAVLRDRTGLSIPAIDSLLQSSAL
jgi:aminoglycoside phosphotransferase (APT) family kinase protein